MRCPSRRRWAFDVELLYLAAHNRIPMVEVPVHWHEVEGSKIDVLTDSLKMVRLKHTHTHPTHTHTRARFSWCASADA